MTRHLPRFALLVSLLTALPAAAHAQGASTGTARGTVLDTSGGVVAGATVELTSARTSAQRRATTDERGAYVFPSVLSGPYRLRVTLAGFAPWESGEVHLSPGDSIQVDATLALGQQTEEMDVVSERQMVRTDHGAREALITSEQIRDLSIVGRGALELLKILPGTVTPDQSSMEVVSFTFEGANDLGRYSLNGSRGTAISPVIDGAKVLDFGSNETVMLNMNPDMAEEIKVQSGNYAAEYGTSPVQITAITKGGSSAFHGSAYDYWRNWRLAANDRSNSYAGIPRPESDFHYPGFNLSGPVLLPGTDFNKGRDRLFFFVGFEVQRQTIDPGTTLAVVPTVAQRQGDFSGFLAGEGQNLGQPSVVTIPCCGPGTGEPAPHNDLGPYIDPMGQAFLSMYPIPNYEDPDNRYNYAFNEPLPVNRWQLTSRVDWNVSEGTHAYVRLALEREEAKWSRGLWNCCSDFALPSRVVGDNRAWSVAVNVTSVLSPSLTNELVIAASRLELDNDWEDPAKVSKATLGLRGFQGVFPSDDPAVPFGIGSEGQYLGYYYSLTGGMPVFAHNDSLSISDTVTQVMSTHTVKLGLFAERGRKQSQDPTYEGLFVLGSPWTAGATGSDYGDLLVGRVAQFYQGTKPPSGEWQFWNLEGYVQDSWKVRRNLSLEGGVRVAWMPNNEELTGLGLRFEPSAYDPTQGPFVDGNPLQPNGVLLESRGEIPKGLTENPGLKLMPRFNFAWDVRSDGDVVLRGGTGLFYRRPPGNYQYSVAGFPPNVFNSFLSFWEVPGGLTLSSLPTIDPWSRLSSGALQSIDARSVHLPGTWNWSLALSKRLPRQQTLEVAYVGSRSDHLPNETPADYVPPGALTGTVGNADLDNPLHRSALDPGVVARFRGFPAYAGIGWFQYEAWSRYQALQVSLSRTAVGPFQYLLNYTLGKTTGTLGDDYAVIDPLDPESRSTGVLSQDRRHIFNVSWNWLLPDPIRPDGSGALRGLLNGWQLSGITNYVSGRPYRLVFAGALAEPSMQLAWWGTDAHGANVRWGGNAGHVAPTFVGDPRLDDTGVGEKVLDIDQIDIPALGESGPFQPPYDLRAPGRWNWDLTIMKNFVFGGGRRLQLRVGVFNLLNQAIPDLLQGDIDLTLQTECNVRVDGVPNGAGGYANNVCDPSQGFRFTELTRKNFGKIVTKRGHRVVELAVRFDF